MQAAKPVWEVGVCCPRVAGIGCLIGTRQCLLRTVYLLDMYLAAATAATLQLLTQIIERLTYGAVYGGATWREREPKLFKLCYALTVV